MKGGIMLRQTIQSFLLTIVFSLFVVFVIWQYNRYTQFPTVYKSWSTQECVRVKDYLGNRYDCGYEEGKRYHTVWMK